MKKIKPIFYILCVLFLIINIYRVAFNVDSSILGYICLFFLSSLTNLSFFVFSEDEIKINYFINFVLTTSIAYFILLLPLDISAKNANKIIGQGLCLLFASIISIILYKKYPYKET